MRVLVVEDEPYLAEAIRDGLRLAAIAADVAGLPILMLTAADRLDDKASGFGLGADDYLTKPFELQELVLRLRALDRRRARSRPPVLQIAGLRLDPFRREVYLDGRYVALTRKQFAVLEVLVTAEGGVVSGDIRDTDLAQREKSGGGDPGFVPDADAPVSGCQLDNQVELVVHVVTRAR
jgi:two-component system response regulator VanR